MLETCVCSRHARLEFSIEFLNLLSTFEFFTYTYELILAVAPPPATYPPHFLVDLALSSPSIELCVCECLVSLECVSAVRVPPWPLGL